ncbi:MAG: DUF5711 family protein [Thermoplasmata archaeon]
MKFPNSPLGGRILPEVIKISKHKQEQTIHEETIWQAKPSWSYPTQGFALAVAISSSGDSILVGGTQDEKNGAVHMFDRTGKLVWKYKTSEPVSTVTITPKGEYLAVGCEDKNLMFFDKTGKIPLWKQELTSRIKSLAISGDGAYVVAGCEDGNIQFFDSNRKVRKFVWKHRCDNSVGTIGITESGEFSFCGSDDGRVYFFDKTGQVLWDFRTGEAVNQVAASGKCDIIVGSNDKSVYCLNLAGRLSWKHLTSGNVTSVGISVTGNCAIAGSQDKTVYCFDGKGNVLWKHELEAPVTKVTISRSGEYMAACAGDKTVYCFDKVGNILWRYTSSDFIWGIKISDDKEYVLINGPTGIICIQMKHTFQEMLRGAQVRFSDAKRIGVDIKDAEYLHQQASMALAAGNYTVVYDNLKRAEESMLIYNNALKKLNEIQDKFNSYSKEGVDLSVPQTYLDSAKESFRLGKYRETIDLVDKTSEALTSAMQHHKLKKEESVKLVEEVNMIISKVKDFGIDVTQPEALLKAAKIAIETREYSKAVDMLNRAGELAKESLNKKGLGAEFYLANASALLSKGQLTPKEGKLVEEYLQNAISEYLERKDFNRLGECYEKYASYLATLDHDESSHRTYLNAVNAAIFAYRDGGNMAKAVELCKLIKDWRNAAKYLEEMGKHEEAKEMWATAGIATKKVPQSSLITRAKLDVIESFLKSKKYFEAADALVEIKRYDEAVQVLTMGANDKRCFTYLMRLLYNLQRYDEMHKQCEKATAKARADFLTEIGRENLQFIGHIAIGNLFLSKIFGKAHDAERILDDLMIFESNYMKAVDEKSIVSTPLSDQICAIIYLLSGDLVKLKELINRRAGDYWTDFRLILEKLDEKDREGFGDAVRTFANRHVGICYNIGSMLPDIAPRGDLHQSLSQLYPFNVNLHISQWFSRLLDTDAPKKLKERADALFAERNWVSAANIYEELLNRDRFDTLDHAEIHIKAGACMKSFGDTEGMKRHAILTGLPYEDALARIDAILGSATPAEPLVGKPAIVVNPDDLYSKKPIVPQKIRETVKTPEKEEKVENGVICPRCGKSAPKTAVRCMNCGKLL